MHLITTKDILHQLHLITIENINLQLQMHIQLSTTHLHNQQFILN